MVEPKYDGRTYGIPECFPYRECYWEWGGSASPQGGRPIALDFFASGAFTSLLQSFADGTSYLMTLTEDRQGWMLFQISNNFN